MRTHVEETRKLSDSNFNDLRTLLNAVPGQIDYILDQFTHTKEKAFDDLDNINSLLGGSIYERLRPKVLPVLKDIKALAEDMKTNRATLVRLNTLLTDMKQSSAHLRTSLRDMKTSIEQTLTDPQCSFPVTATTCASISQSLSVLDGSANFDQANDSLSDIPEEVKNQTRDFISEFKKTLNSIHSDVKNVSTKIPIQKTLSNFVRYINNSEDYILHYLPTVEKCNSYRSVPSLSSATMSVQLAGEGGENLTI
nr:prominin-1-like isoform X2 [Odocoileus virginianus texanus]